MGANSSAYPTLLDLAKTLDPNGSAAEIVEILDKKDELIQWLPFSEGNLPTGHRTTVRTGIPAPTWRKMYQMVMPTKATTAQVTDNCGMMENFGEIDKAIADLNGNSASFLLSQSNAVLEGFKQEFGSTFWYGNEGSEPEAFTGLSPRFNSTTAANGDNIILGGSADTDNASIWLLVANNGDDGLHGIVPKGSKTGWQFEDLGVQTKENSEGLMQVRRTHFRWDCGLTVPDWRQIVRIANIEVSALTKDAVTGPDLVDLMTQALELIHNLDDGKAAFFMNRKLRGFLRRQMVNSVTSSTLTMQQLTGPNGSRPVMHLDEVPVFRSDSLLNTEALVA